MKDVITENYQLMFGDCLERMKEIVDNAPEWAVWFDPNLNDYGDGDWNHIEGMISIDGLIHIPTIRTIVLSVSICWSEVG